MRTVISLTAGLLLVSLASLSAQQAPPVEVGSRVRVTAPGLGIYRQVATLEAWRGDTLVLAAERTMNCPLASVTRLEVSRGREQSTGTAALVGFLVGSGVGAGLGLVLCLQAPWGGGCGGGVAVVAAIFGGVGAGLGVLSTAHVRERWEEISVGRVRVAPVATSDGRFGVAAAVRF